MYFYQYLIYNVWLEQEYNADFEIVEEVGELYTNKKACERAARARVRELNDYHETKGGYKFSVAQVPVVGK